jgi:hypothetical protein
MNTSSKRYRWYHMGAADDWQLFGTATLGKDVCRRDAHKRFFEFVEEVAYTDGSLRWVFMAENGAFPGTRIYFLVGGSSSVSDLRRNLKIIWSHSGNTLEMIRIRHAEEDKAPGYRRLLKTIRKKVCFLLKYTVSLAP